MRADARHRRELLVVAAREVFAERGGDAPLEAVAQRAGVGIATLYRNFATREELQHATALDALETGYATVQAALRQVDSDPAGALAMVAHRLGTLRMAALVSQLVRRDVSELPEYLLATRARNLAAMAELLAATTAAGVTRPDIDAMEFVYGIGLLSRPIPPLTAELPANYLERLITVYLAGMRPDGDPLPPPVEHESAER